MNLLNDPTPRYKYVNILSSRLVVIDHKFFQTVSTRKVILLPRKKAIIVKEGYEYIDDKIYRKSNIFIDTIIYYSEVQCCLGISFHIVIIVQHTITM
jgi:hypothetical protein